MFGLNKETKIHFIGIGGIGMSGIAEVLLSLGYKVSGSDVADGPTVLKLQKQGAEIFVGHKKENIKDANIIVYSSAIKESNPEYKVALEKKLPIIKRAEMLAELMRLKYGLAVAGTHGKTTTTSFLATILYECGLDPTHVIGGVVSNLGGHARIGKEKFFVAEADESDGSFLYLNPVMSVITNIDNDHLDYYKTEENILNAFTEFINKVPFYGKVALNGHDKNIAKIMNRIKRPYLTFGIHCKGIAVDKLDVVAKNIRYESSGVSFDLNYLGEEISNFRISITGEHNVLNSLGAITIARELGLDFNQIKKAVVAFKGVGRRMEKLFESDDVLVIDDYGHHPTEVSVTLSAIKKSFPDYHLVTFFEPHRFTRTRDCWNQFLNCFNNSDEVYVTPIYAASEEEIENINSFNLVRDINRLHPGMAKYLNGIDEIKDKMNLKVKSKTIYLTLCAGTIGKKIREILKGV